MRTSKFLLVSALLALLGSAGCSPESPAGSCTWASSSNSGGICRVDFNCMDGMGRALSCTDTECVCITGTTNGARFAATGACGMSEAQQLALLQSNCNTTADAGGTDAARPMDSGRTDAGGTDAARTDAGGTDAARTDTGGSDPCATDQANATSTVGCNGGFVSGDPAANTAGGTCTGGGMAMPAGTCSTSSHICSAESGMMGRCTPTCTPGASYVTRGECPTGWRCFDLDGTGICFRDCDATHACPADQMCDNEGSCVN